jgi:molybdenum cofactor sulfurtransferase
MGGALYPESLVRVHTDFLSRSILGNTHSVSNRCVYAACSPLFLCMLSITRVLSSSNLSTRCADEARAAVLSFFKAPPEYTVIFTANTTASLKLIGESYPFAEGSSYVLGTDSHNSVRQTKLYHLCTPLTLSLLPYRSTALENMLAMPVPRSTTSNQHPKADLTKPTPK